MDRPDCSIVHHAALQSELEQLARDDRREYAAVRNAILKLKASDGRLGYPWTSAVRGPDRGGLRELRPRAGHSRVRVLYAQRSSMTLLLALAREGGDNPRAFHRAVLAAQRRLAAMTDDGVST